MGDRASVVFFDAYCVSPTIYLHWHGSVVPIWLDELKLRMEGRFSDASYAAARFVGICHQHIDGNLSLGIYSNAYRRCDLQDAHAMRMASPGNAGIVVVNTCDFSWRAYGGYLTDYTTERNTI